MEPNPHITIEERDKLIEDYRGYARAIALKMSRKYSRRLQEEILSFADMGLVKAAGSFKPKLNVTFRTYSYYRIRGEILDGLREMQWFKHREGGADGARDRKAVAAEETRDNFAASGMWELQGNETPEQRENKFYEAVRTAAVVFLTSQLGEGEAPEPAARERTADIVQERELVLILQKAIAEMPPEDQIVIKGRFYEDKTYDEVGKVIGRHRANVLHAERRIIEKLRRAIGLDPPADS